MAPSPTIIEKYQRILQADPRSRIFVELARNLLEAGDPERAAEVCERGLEHHPSSVQARVIWGKALIALGRTDTAVTRLEEAIAADPANPYGYDLVGEVLVGSGLAERARALLEKGAALHPGDGRIRKWLAEARRAAPETADTAQSQVPAQTDTAAPHPDPLPATRGEGGVGSTSTECLAPLPASRGGGDVGPTSTECLAPFPASWGGGDVSSTSTRFPAPLPAARGEGEVGPALTENQLSSTAPAEPSPPRDPTPGRDEHEPGSTPSGSLSLPRPPPLKTDPRRSKARTENGADGGNVLDLIPEAPAAPEPARKSAPVDGARKESGAVDEASEADAAALTYEHELREKFLAEPPPRPSFLRRHTLGAALVGVALAIAAGVAIFLAVRSSRRAVEARAAVEAARTGLARDTLEALRASARVLEAARRAAPANAEAAGVEAEVLALLAHDFGDLPARERVRELIATGGAGEGAIAARWLVAEPGEESAAAEALLDHAHAADGTPLVRALAGELLLARRDRDGAQIHLEAAAHASPPLLRALAALGDLELARGDAEAALERYALVLRAHPTHPHAAIGAAEARLRLGRDLPEALRVLEAVASAPDSTPALRDRLRLDLLLARLLAASGRTADAERRLREAASRNPAQAEVAAAQAEVFTHAGDLERALRSAEGAVRLAPGNASYREILVRLQLRRGLYREVLAASETSTSRPVRLYRGVARFELGQPIQALAELEGTRREGKMPAEAAGWMALAHLAAGHRAQAAAIVAALLAAPNPHALALVARGRLDLAAGQADSAERRFREAVDRDPDLIEARCDLGRTLLGRGRVTEARDVLEKTVARNPYYLQARFELGRARLATGDAAGAVRALETVVAERPQEVPVLVALSSAHLARGNPDEARRIAERALKLAPRSAAAALAAGKAAAGQGALRDARKLLEHAAKLGGTAPEGADARRALASLKRR
jgi:tetratricopeptide (TPR) repeat protein